jgi:hypothetical protein
LSKFRAEDAEFLAAISVRMSTVEFMDTCILELSKSSEQVLQKILSSLYSNNLPEGVIGSEHKYLTLQ